MLSRRIRVTGAPEAPLRAALAALRARLGVPEGFPPEVGEEAERAAKSPPPPSYDATDLPFFTLDPPGSPDLDQATHLSRRGTGYRVRYAIADVAAFVAPGGALDAEAQRRVNTLYFPDERVPLHPAVLSEGAASLLPGRTRPAVLWTIDLDAEGRALAVEVRRALVRSRARLDYAGVQRAIDTGTAEEPVALLREIGRARERQEAARGGISLTVPEQEITERDHTYALSYRAPLPAEAWNAQLSLLTGMAAADLMLARGTGILRTLPPAPDGAVARLRRTARALGVDWPHHVPYAAVISALDPRVPHHAAFLQECTTLLRGAGYTVFRDGALPAITTHAAMAAPYTHCTAPLRRLADRYALELSLSAASNDPPPDWVLAALDALPHRMADGAQRASTVEHESIDIVAAALLKDRVGETFDACVVDLDDHHAGVGTVQLASPAVLGRVEGPDLPLGDPLRVRLVKASPGSSGSPGTARPLFIPA
ncbi:RNB domain-containing ribonuclease [Streptomyces griseofuscus]|uniref:RNB domain-containing ribonuclease n=1 Tax=Streptomyces TaxID=1883 RepID=UPI000B87254D|nr:RNB domain-containing ribonuclease [Streptomyces sp. LamerLS-31b]